VSLEIITKDFHGAEGVYGIPEYWWERKSGGMYGRHRKKYLQIQESLE
jgi:hypothetical protein